MQTRIRRCVFSYVANAVLLTPLAGCSALQEPGPQLALATLRENTVRIAEAATTNVARLGRIRNPFVAVPHAERPASWAPAPIDYLDLPAHPVRYVRVPPARALHARVHAAAVITRQAVIAALRYRAENAEAANDPGAAAAALGRLLALTPSDAAGWLRLARLQLRFHDDAPAAASLERALAVDPNNAAALLARAQLRRRNGAYAAAVADLDAYLTRHGVSRQVLRMKIDAAEAAGDTAAALEAIDAYIAVAPDDAAVLHEQGNLLDADGDAAGALAAWKAYAARRPDDADVDKQIAYASERSGDIASAIAAWNAYIRLRPSDDRLRLALAYDEARAGDRARATAAFEQLESSPDADVAKQAAAELRARMTAGSSTGSHLAYATVEYDSRFGDVVFGVDTYALAPQRRFQPYAVLHSWDDTRSSARAYEPMVYNDNAEIFGGGFRYNIGSHPGQYFFAEGGEQISLIGRGTSPELRYGFASWSESGTPGRGHTSFGFSLASYSRYGADVIGYSNIRHDFPLFSSLRGVVGTNFALDTHRQYWNNIGELELGVKVGSPRFSFTLAGVDGWYLPRGAASPARRTYTTLRPSITWSPQL